MSGNQPRILGMMLGWALVLCTACWGWCQEAYKSDPLDPAFVMPDASKFDKSKREEKAELANLEKGIKAARSASEEIVDGVFRGSADLNTARAEFDRYYNGLAFPNMTQVDDESLAKLGEQRSQLLRQVRDTPNDSPLRKHLVEELIVPYFSRVMTDSGYHPAVRLNAALVLGGVNRRDGQRNVEPSLPLEMALRALLAVASAQDTPGYLKAGSLSGILRHATIDGQLEQPVMDNALREQVINMAIGVLDSTVPANGAALTDEQYWLRRQAVQILGAFRVPGTDGKILAALRKVLEDDQSPLWLSADAVEALGNMRIPAADQVDVANVAKLIGSVVSRFLKADIQSIDDYVAGIRENRLIARRSTQDGADDKDAGAAPDESGATSGTAQKKGSAAAAGGALAQTAGTAAPVDVPNYKINDVRSRTKFIVFVARKALDGMPPRRRNEQKQPENLKALADADTAKMIEQMVIALDKVMEETDLAPPKAPAPTAQAVAAQKPQKPLTNDERLRTSLQTGIQAVETAIGGAGAVQPAVKSAIGS